MPQRKKTYRKRRTSKRKTRIPRSIKNGSITFAKIKDDFQVTNSANNTFNGSFTLAQIASAEDWTNYTGLYETFRIHAIKVQWIPTFNINETPTATFPAYSPLYIAYNKEAGDQTKLDTVAEIIAYNNVKFKNIMRPFTYYVKCPKITSLLGAYPVFTGGYIDIDGVAQCPGIIGYVSSNNIANVTTIIGTWLATWYVSFKTRK